MLISDEDLMNESVREVMGEIHLRSARRKSSLTPNLFSEVYDYAAPSDLMANRIIDLPPQILRESGDEINLVPHEEFDRLKPNNAIALYDYNGTRRLKIAKSVDDKVSVVSTMDSLTAGGGTWVLFGDAENVVADADDYLLGIGSIKFGISSAGGTTAGLQNTGLNSFDLDDEYLGGNGAAFAYVKINDITNITNFIFRIGSSTSAYHSKTVTAQHDGTAFVNGWNLLRFDLTSLTDTGTPNDDAITYVALYMTKDAAKVSETDYKIDHIVLRKGKIYNVDYYTKYGWQSSAAAYKENSTADTDLLVADTDEFDLFVLKGRARAAMEVGEPDLASIYETQYQNKNATYQKENPSEAKIMTSEYYSYA